MSYQLRTRDVILCENKQLNQTSAYVISKELISEYLSSQCKLAFPVEAHDGFHELNITMELGE